MTGKCGQGETDQIYTKNIVMAKAYHRTIQGNIMTFHQDPSGRLTLLTSP